MRHNRYKPKAMNMAIGLIPTASGGWIAAPSNLNKASNSDIEDPTGIGTVSNPYGTAAFLTWDLGAASVGLPKFVAAVIEMTPDKVTLPNYTSNVSIEFSTDAVTWVEDYITRTGYPSQGPIDLTMRFSLTTFLNTRYFRLRFWGGTTGQVTQWQINDVAVFKS